MPPADITAPDPGQRAQTGFDGARHLVARIGIAHIGFAVSDHQPPPRYFRRHPDRRNASVVRVRALLGDRVTDTVTERRMLSVDQFADGAEFRDYFKAVYGPTISVYRNIEGDPDRVAALDADIARLGDSVLSRSSTMEWEYLLLTARKA